MSVASLSASALAFSLTTSRDLPPRASSTGFSLMTDHVISVVGWGTDPKEGLYWIVSNARHHPRPSPSLSPAAPFARQVRNSWGEYWGEQGYVNVKSGALALERSCAWATVADFTAPEKKNQYHCFEDGSNCDASKP